MNETARDWHNYECARGHQFWSAPAATQCPTCGTTTLTPHSVLRDHVLGPVGPGTPAARMRAVWEWLHQDGAGREKILEELCPGYSIVQSKITSEQALMVAFDRLVAEREWETEEAEVANPVKLVDPKRDK